PSNTLIEEPLRNMGLKLAAASRENRTVARAQRNSVDQQSVGPSVYTFDKEEAMTPSHARRFIVSTLIAAIPITIVAVASSCTQVFSAVGLTTIDSAEAVAIAQRNLCGGAGGTTCAVRDYRRNGGRFIITLDRRP